MSNPVKIKIDIYNVYKYNDGSEFWYTNSTYSRINGPAIKWANGNEEWWLHGKCTKVDGPAIKYIDGRESYYLNNFNLLKQEYKLISISLRTNIIYERFYRN